MGWCKEYFYTRASTTWARCYMQQEGCTSWNSNSQYNQYTPRDKIIARPKMARSDTGICTHTTRNQKNQSIINSCKSRSISNCCGWQEVRYVMGYHGKWHPATDHLAGTQAYGLPFTDANNWSIKFSHMKFN